MILAFFFISVEKLVKSEIITPTKFIEYPNTPQAITIVNTHSNISYLLTGKTSP